MSTEAILALKAEAAQLRSDLRAAEAERDEAREEIAAVERALEGLEETPLARRVGHWIGVAAEETTRANAAEANLIALAKMYGEACGELAKVHWFARRCAVSEISDVFEAMTVEGEQMEARALAAEAEREQRENFWRTYIRGRLRIAHHIHQILRDKLFAAEAERDILRTRMEELEKLGREPK